MCFVAAPAAAVAAQAAGTATAAQLAAISAASMTNMMAASMVASGLGMGMQFIGNYQQQKATNASLKYQARINERNAQIAEMEAEFAEDAAKEKQDKHEKQVRQFLGSQRAAMSGSGMVVDEGSFLDVTLDTAEGGALDALAIEHEGDLEAWRARMTAGNYTAQAGLNRASTSSPFMAAAPSLLTGAANMGMNYYKMT